MKTQDVTRLDAGRFAETVEHELERWRVPGLEVAMRPDGAVGEVVVTLEPSVEPIRFERVKQ